MIAHTDEVQADMVHWKHKACHLEQHNHDLEALAQLHRARLDELGRTGVVEAVAVQGEQV